MRPLLVCFFLLLLAQLSARAQSQEGTLSERLFGPRDEKKVYDTRKSTFSGGRSVSGKKAASKDFQYDQKVRLKEYGTDAYWGVERSWSGQVQYSAKAARIDTGRVIPNVDQQKGQKSAPVKDARESGKRMATRDLHDGQRQFLGKENDRLRKPVDPSKLLDWRKQGVTVVQEGGTADGRRVLPAPVEIYGDLKELTVDDVRELLNKR